MILLAIDSAGASCSAALWGCSPEGRAEPPPDGCPAGLPDGLLAWRVLEPARGQAERLIGLVEAVLHDAGRSYGSLGAIAVNHGPGSFTGLRSAVAAARGLALAAGLGVIAVSSLEALACGVRPSLAGDVPPGDILAALDARRGEIYVQRFAPDLTPRQGPLGLPCAMSPHQAASYVSGQISGPLRLVGSGAPLIRAVLPAEATVLETVRLDARLVARRAAWRLAAGEQPVAGFEVRPLYLRPPDARPQAPLVRRAAPGVAAGAA